MKQLFTILFLCVCALNVFSQNHVFVIVDGSKSIKQNDLTEAKQALSEVLNYKPLSKAFISFGQRSDLAKFKIVKGDFLSISKFGNLSLTSSINPSPIQINNIKNDVIRAIGSIDWTPTDSLSYYVLAKAKIAEYAKLQKISSYKLYIISDKDQNYFGPGGKPEYPDDANKNLADGYNTSKNQVLESGYTKIKFSYSSPFTLSFTPNVDVSNYEPFISKIKQKIKIDTPKPSSPIKPVISSDTSSITPVITFTIFQDGKKDKPIKTNSNTFNVSWSYSGKTETKFNVFLTEIDGSKYKDKKINLTSNSIKFTDVPSGVFKIIISASNATSAITYIETPTSNTGLLLLVLLIIVAAFMGYRFWNNTNKPNKKIDEKVKEIFSSDNSVSPQSTKSNHY